MKASQMLSKIKSLLGEEVKLAELKLENGTILEAESFENHTDKRSDYEKSVFNK